MSAPQPPAPVKSALRTLDLIEFVVAHPKGAIAQEIAAALGIPVSSLSYLLVTLAEREYLLRDGRLYRAGPGLDRLRAPRDTLPLADRAAPLVRATRGELDETTSFMVRAGWECEALVTEASAQALRYAFDPGERRPLHALAAGKVLLAALSEPDLAAYFAQSQRAVLTPHTPCDEAPCAPRSPARPTKALPNRARNRASASAAWPCPRASAGKWWAASAWQSPPSATTPRRLITRWRCCGGARRRWGIRCGEDNTILRRTCRPTLMGE